MAFTESFVAFMVICSASSLFHAGTSLLMMLNARVNECESFQQSTLNGLIRQ